MGPGLAEESMSQRINNNNNKTTFSALDKWAYPETGKGRQVSITKKHMQNESTERQLF